MRNYKQLTTHIDIIRTILFPIEHLSKEYQDTLIGDKLITISRAIDTVHQELVRSRNQMQAKELTLEQYRGQITHLPEGENMEDINHTIPGALG